MRSRWLYIILFLAIAAILAGISFLVYRNLTISPITYIVSPSTTPSPTPSFVTPSPSTIITTPVPTVAQCAASDLALSVVPQQGAAGTIIYTLTLTNQSNHPCTLFGYPGVQLLLDSQPIGNPASRQPSVPEQTVTLSPGQAARANMAIPNSANFPSGVCSGLSTSIGVYPPGSFTQLTVPFSAHYCPGFSVTVVYS